MVGERVGRERYRIDQGGEGGAQRKSLSSTCCGRVGGTGLGELHISRTDRNRGRSCTKPKDYTNRWNRWAWAAYLITGADYLLLATITTSGVLLTGALPDYESLRVDDLDKVVWVLLRGDPLTQVSIIVGTAKADTHAKHRLQVS